MFFLLVIQLWPTFTTAAKRHNDAKYASKQEAFTTCGKPPGRSSWCSLRWWCHRAGRSSWPASPAAWRRWERGTCSRWLCEGQQAVGGDGRCHLLASPRASCFRDHFAVSRNMHCENSHLIALKGKHDVTFLSRRAREPVSRRVQTAAKSDSNQIQIGNQIGFLLNSEISALPADSVSTPTVPDSVQTGPQYWPNPTGRRSTATD